MQVRNLTGCKPDRWVFHAGIFDGTVHSPSICATLPPMRNLTATICLTVAVLLGSAGGSRAQMPGQLANSFDQGSNWYCNSGYRKSGNECVSIFR